MQRSSPSGYLLMLSTMLAACTSDPATAPSPREMPVASVNAAATGAGPREQLRLLARVLAATAKYHRVSVALEDGYTFITPCFYSASGLGARGIFYRKTALLDAVVQPEQPEILMYEPQENGTLKLVGVHFVVLATPWEAANPGRVPMLGSEPLRDRRAPGAAPFPAYSLYVALWRRNPSGLYADFNPAVSCRYATVSAPQ